MEIMPVRNKRTKRQQLNIAEVLTYPEAVNDIIHFMLQFSQDKKFVLLFSKYPFHFGQEVPGLNIL
ncbi:MAG: hypothetical protein A2309_03605 [Bacteroidetes bacterium RIFOXYB2_FULL_35_7]|nr:MAG: hypothetical protein A2309_03605 [Bacteroidetes bacterium RIFOXYB2_FULL_35_7]